MNLSLGALGDLFGLRRKKDEGPTDLPGVAGGSDVAMGQKPVPPVDIPIPTKVD